MPPRSVLVTYTLHPSPNPGSVHPIQVALKGIRAQIPLRNLHWKSSSRTALRTIQELDVTLLELGEVGSVSKEVGGSVLQWPLVDLCLVVCEDSELYRTQTRSFIQDWLSLLAARRHVHAPLIVLVNPSSAANSGKNVFGRDKGVLGKIKADFNAGKRDRCAQINLPPKDADDLAAWPEIINRLKDSIVVAFDGAILEREEEVKRGEAQRLSVGWNFCTWFLLKESLAHSFEGVNLHEDALIVYEELEAAFFQVLKEQNLSWFGKLGATGPRDDSLPVLDTAAKPYREMLQTSSISIFDFRVYVFARQAQLLGRLGRITEIAKRGQWFVASLTRRLRESEADLAQHFIEAWTYTACMDIVQKCDEWSRIDHPNGDYTGLIAYESARSELLDIARVQVERIGVACGHLPDVYPFSQSSTMVSTSDDVLFECSDSGVDNDDNAKVDEPASRGTVSNRQLAEAMADVIKFRNLYLALTKKAIIAYEACCKANSVLRLKTDLAGLALHTKEWITAYDLCRDLAKECAALLTWDPIAKYALEGALRAHTELRKERSEDWMNLAVAYMRVCAVVEDEADPGELHLVLTGLSDVGSAQSIENHKAFGVRLLSEVARVGEEADVSEISIEVQNSLPVPVAIGEIALDFEDAEGEGIAYVGSYEMLQPGYSKLSLSCSTSTLGHLILQTARLCIGEITFVYPRQDDPATLHVRRNLTGLTTVLRMPYDLALDAEPRFVMEIHSKSCTVKGAQVEVSSVNDDVRYLLEDASSEDTSATVEGVVLGDIEPNNIVYISIPYSGSPQGDVTKARVHLTYDSQTRPGQMRSYDDIQTIATGLPLTVNVQDFFRPECLISHFTIASDGTEHLHVGSVELRASDTQSFEVEACSNHWDQPVTVTPGQPLSSLFRIRRTDQSTNASVLRLVIRYRSLVEEVRQLLEKSLATFAPTSDTNHATLRRLVQQALADPASWLQTYLLERDLSSLTEGVKSNSPDKQWHSFIDHIGAINTESLPWRTLEIPVDVPSRRLLSAVSISHASPGGSVYEGRALAMNVRLTSDFSWVGDGVDLEGTRMVFDVQASSEDWLVLGKKKGYYSARSDVPEIQQVVLVPMRAGSLFLPSVSVHLLSPREDGVTCETYVENAAETVNVLPAKSSTTVLVPVHEQWPASVEEMARG